MPFDLDCRDIPKPSPDPLDAFDGFVSAVRQRLEAGRVAYGDKSFNRPPAELVREIQAELLDVCGWSFILYQRLDAVLAALPPPERSCACSG